MRSILSVAVAVAAAATLATAASAAPATRPVSTTAAARLEPHPEIRDAIRALERAKDHLRHAKHDFGGHRVEAIGAIDRAIEQLKLALEYDK